MQIKSSFKAPMRNNQLLQHAALRAIVNRPQMPIHAPAYNAADHGLLKGMRKKKRTVMASQHDQTHAGAFDEPSGMGGAYGGGA